MYTNMNTDKTIIMAALVVISYLLGINLVLQDNEGLRIMGIALVQLGTFIYAKI